MADFKIELKNSLNSKMYPKTTLDNIIKSVASSTTLIASGGVIKKDFLDLTGLIDASYVSSANIIPTSAVSGLTTAITNGASSYVHSSAVIPVSAVNGLATSLSSKFTASSASSPLFVSSGVLVITDANMDTGGIQSKGVVKTNYNVNYNANSGTNYDEDTNEVPTLKGVEHALAYKQNTMSAGFGLVISGGTSVQLARTRPITTVPAASTTVTIEPGEAYVVDATTTSKTFNMGTVSAGHFGLESHIELFVANEGYIHVGSNVTLVDPLEPDAVNNCTVRFHDGHAIISVEDHVEAYMVNNTSTGSSTAGALAYGLKQTGNVLYNYIGFRSELNTSSVPTGGASATVMKRIVGNGMEVGPTITGNLIVKSGATIRDVKLSGVTVTSGKAILTNVYIPSGGTVSVGAGGEIFPEKLYGDGGTVNLGGIAQIYTFDDRGHIYMSGCSITSGHGNYGAAMLVMGSASLNNVSFIKNSAGANTAAFQTYGSGAYINYVSGSVLSNYSPGENGAVYVGQNTTINLSNCEIAFNTATRYGAIVGQGNLFMTDCYVHDNTGGNQYGAIMIAGVAKCTISGSTIGSGQSINNGGAVSFAGSNYLDNAIVFGTGSATIASGAILDLTGNTNATPIAPGGGITFGENVTILTGSNSGVAENTLVISNLGNVSYINIAGEIALTVNYYVPANTNVVLDNVRLMNGKVVYAVNSNTTVRIKDGSIRSSFVIASGSGSSIISNTLRLRGSVQFAGGVYIDSIATNGYGGIITIDDNSTIDTTYAATTFIGVSHPIATLIIGSGVKIGGVSITGGTYHNVTVNKNGTITTA